MMDNFCWLTPHIPTLMAIITMGAELKCATMKFIVPYVMRDGQTTKRQFSVTT